MNTIKQEMADLSIVGQVIVKSELDEENIHIKREFDCIFTKMNAFQLKHHMADRFLVECIVKILRLYVNKGLPNFATMDMHQLFCAYMVWNTLCRVYFRRVNQAFNVGRYRYHFNNITINNTRRFVKNGFHQVEYFNEMMKLHQSGGRIAEIERSCDVLLKELFDCFRKLSGYATSTTDHNTHESPFVRIDDSLKNAIEDLFDATVFRQFYN